MYARLDPVKLADTQVVADKLASLPHEALVYISGYVGGYQDAVNQQKTRTYSGERETLAVGSAQQVQPGA